MTEIASPESRQNLNIEPMHGRVVTPKSRAIFAREQGLLPDDNIPNAIEGGKFWPLEQDGLADPVARDDVRNRLPPRDEHIASADVESIIPAAAVLNEVQKPNGQPWDTHRVTPGQQFEVIWDYTMNHKSRRWKAYITKSDWDRKSKLTRAQFDLTPLRGGLEFDCNPFWSCDGLQPPSPHKMAFELPQSYTGTHVVLVIWEIADTAAAFYQVIDVDFGS